MQQEQIYNTAVELSKSKRAIDIKRALDLFESIPDYKDASSCAQACRERLDKLAHVDINVPVVYKKNWCVPVFIVYCLPVFIVIACLLFVCVISSIVVPFLSGKKGELTVTPFTTPTEPQAHSQTPTAHPTATASPTVLPTTMLPATPFTTLTETQPRFPTSTAHPTATASPTILPTTVATASSIPQFGETVKIGDVIQFGVYEQDNMYDDVEPIDWIVLDQKDGKALLLSQYGLDCQPYNMTRTSVTWETCSLRQWLNTTFYATAFSTAQQELILTTTVTNPDNPNYGTEGGNDTQDKMFLLSLEEALQYFATDESRIMFATAYTTVKSERQNDSLPGDPWWLRTPGKNSEYVCDVYSAGHFGIGPYDGSNVDYARCAIRPAMWVSLSN